MKSSYSITTWKLKELYDMIVAGHVELPGFQRSIVWTKGQQDSFIESLKAGYPFGSLLVYKEKDGRYLLIDGLQRSSTIRGYFSKPTEFFVASDISKRLAEFLASRLPGHDAAWESEDIHNNLENWFIGLELTSLDDFKPSKGFKSQSLLTYLRAHYGFEMDREAEIRLADEIEPMLETLKDEADISQCDVPVILYTSEKEKLPEVFRRLNKGGTQLNKYQIYAAVWMNKKVRVEDKPVRDAIKSRFEDYIEKGFTVQGYDSDAFDGETEFTLFEYLYGLGKVLASSYPYLFDSGSDKDAEADSYGFNLCTYSLNLNVTEMDKLAELIPYGDIATFQENLLQSAKEVEDCIRPYTGVNANRKKNLTKPERPQIYHSEFQIVSLIAKLYRLKYVEKADDERLKSFKENLPYHYLYDIIDDFWRGSGNTKAYTLIQSGSRYEQPIDRVRWSLALDKWLETQLSSRKEKERAGLKASDILFLKYIYSHKLRIFEDLSTSNMFEIEHLVSVAKLKQLAQKTDSGLPMSAIANLSLLTQDINRKKKESGLYEYFKEDSPELRDIEERFTFTRREDLVSVDADTERYLAFLRKRFELLKKNFFEANGIR